jgi:patatin-like phospholipase/acyl hydrolase
MKKFKILCIDGGGIKGLYSAIVLEKLEEKFNCRLSDKFDLICGTSTGGIIALAVAMRIPMSEVVKLYEEKGPIIFDEEKKKSRFGRMRLCLKQILWGGKYSSAQLEKSLREVFGIRTIGDSSNLLCVPAYSLSIGKPRVFKKDYGELTTDDRLSCVDVALATSAAPTYFPVKEIDDRQYVDGGVWGNNPSLVGLLEYIYKISKMTDLGYDEVEMLSISSIEFSKGEIHKKESRSFLDWNSLLFDLFSNGQAKFDSFLLEQLASSLRFPVNYVRIQNEKPSGEFEKIIGMDNASPQALKELRMLGKDTAANACVNQSVIDIFKTDKTFNFKINGK